MIAKVGAGIAAMDYQKLNCYILVRPTPGHGTRPDAQPYAKQFHRAEWTRGEGIRRLSTG